MPLTALMLVLAAAVLHATWNIVAKRAGGDHRFTLLTGLLTSVLWLPAGLWFGWQELPRWGWAEWSIVSLSAAVHLLYFNALLTGYRKSDLTVVYPVARGSGPLLTALQSAPLSHVAPAREVSMLFAALLGGHLLGERDRGLRLLGAACMAAGVMALAMS